MLENGFHIIMSGDTEAVFKWLDNENESSLTL